ncbi:HMG-box [Basidiobolus meristosporus CBS 931.73]|uniref:HMG-box n=1 Tax=Basidiobolus meristosporus CBS 931.73 TaxID=1314790 RepID=A0A1Y1Y2Z0_9FUNG|nr:HMG-box [Basidiobolus meristosporus CBS 931.73]|eukprot:ORX92382.1 HMG-box [Basidiobolus meristosporus CBS 931.73]
MAAVVDAHKRPRDPDAPRMPFPAYIMFCNDERPKLLEKCSNTTSQEITKKLGELWKHLPEETRKKYDDRYQLERQRYEQELTKYKRIKEVNDRGMTQR